MRYATNVTLDVDVLTEIEKLTQGKSKERSNVINKLLRQSLGLGDVV